MQEIKDRAQVADGPVYSVTARRFHWWTVAFVAMQILLGLYMTYRGNTLNVWDALTNALYSSHKLLGIMILVLMVTRLVYRFSHGAPPDEPTLEPWQKGASHATHWALYALLLAVPFSGYIGISLFPALDIFGLFSLPALAAPDKDAAATVFYWHWVGAVAIILLATVHIGAAVYHYYARKDGVLRRMLVKAGRY